MVDKNKKISFLFQIFVETRKNLKWKAFEMSLSLDWIEDTFPRFWFDKLAVCIGLMRAWLRKSM